MDRPRWLQTFITLPLVHFLALGGALYGLTRWLPEGPLEVVVPHHRLEQQRLDTARHLGAALSAEQDAELIRDLLHEELLVRGALERRLHRKDPVIRRRLAATAGFLLELPYRDDNEDQLLEAALEMRLEETDPAVRALLRERLLLELRVTIPEPPPEAVAPPPAGEATAGPEDPRAAGRRSAAWKRQQYDERVEALLDELRGRYRVSLEEAPA